jgi:hypothetical protein
MATVFADYTELKHTDNATYRLIVKLGNQGGYRLTGDAWDFGPGGWNVANNPWMVTEQQWRTLALRTLTYDSLKETPISKLIENFSYEQKIVNVAGTTYYLPSGNIVGWLQGMYVCINTDGQINS